MDSGTPRLPRARPPSRRGIVPILPVVAALLAAVVPVPAAFLPAALRVYSIGEPTGEEQQYLEWINRARANPAAEAQRWRATTDPDVLAAYAAFGVEVNLMAAQISALAPAPPLAFNAQLLEAARRHTRDQFNGGFQSHVGSDGSNPGSRITAAGYAWSTCGENVYAAARSVAHGQAAFEVDWGFGAGGMLTPAGHRLNLHNPNYREAGIGVTNGFNGVAGPQVVTEDFAARAGLTPFITGVVHYDLNGNGEYDAGEGLGGVRVGVPGAEYEAVTSASGGYAVPVPGNGAYSVTFSAAHLPPVTRSVIVTGGVNVKLDWRPVYAPAVSAGPLVVSPGQPAAYTFTPVGGALAHEWQQGRRVAQAVLDDAESGAGQASAAVSPGYAVVQGAVRAAGAAAFRLAHPLPADQALTWRWQLRPGPDGRLDWSSRLGWATASQVARVQVTTNGGVAWQDVWSRIGTGDGGQASFERAGISLAPFAGREILLRFQYDHLGGSYFNQVSDGVGWYFDDLRVSGCEQWVETEIRAAEGLAFTFTPARAAEYALRVRAVTAAGPLDWGPALAVGATGTNPGPVVRLVTAPVLAGGRVTFEFTVEGGAASGWAVETAEAPAGPWSVDESAVMGATATAGRFRASSGAGTAGRRFYRVAVR